MLGLMQDAPLLISSLLDYAQANDVVVVDALPMTATGKVSKLALREQFRDHLVKPRKE